LTDVFDHNPDDHDDPRAVPIWYLGLVGVVLMVVIVLGLTAVYYNVKAEVYADQVLRRTYREVQDLRAGQEALLAGGTVEVEVQGETVRKNTMPIEDAMRLVVEAAGTGGS
jgi:hypothetical protein